MNTAHWHLALNHLPIIGLVIGLLVLITGFFLKNNTIKQTALGIFVFAAITAIPTFLTGEGAEELVENMPGVSETIIESHASLGEVFLIAILILGLFSLVNLVLSILKSKTAFAMYIVVLIASIGVSVLAKQVGTSGGEIRHTEIRSSFVNQNGSTFEEQNKNSKEDEEDDDD